MNKDQSLDKKYLKCLPRDQLRFCVASQVSCGLVGRYLVVAHGEYRLKA